MPLQSKYELRTSSNACLMPDHEQGYCSQSDPLTLRILHVSQPVTTGVCTVVSGLADYQASRGHQVHLASPRGELPNMVAHAAIWHEWSATRQPGASIICEVSRLRAIVRDVEPDLIHLHSSKAGLCGRLVVRGRIPTVYQPHGWSFLAVDGAAARMARLWERHSARWATSIVCVSDAEEQIGKATGVRPPHYDQCPNAVRMADFGSLTRDEARATLNLDPHSPLVLFVGRLARQKGLDLLLDAWEFVREAIPGSTLLVVGDGPEMPEVKRRASGMNGSVLIAGARQDVSTWYSAADLVVLPSRYEGMALTPLEAMASGVSVVGFDVQGFAESMGATGSVDVVLPVGDTGALAASICRRLRESDLRFAEGRRNRLHVSTHHNATQAAQRMENVYAYVRSYEARCQ
jgi:glycosyltransferase involved in cell wall biosynthesis